MGTHIQWEHIIYMLLCWKNQYSYNFHMSQNDPQTQYDPCQYIDDILFRTRKKFKIGVESQNSLE